MKPKNRCAHCRRLFIANPRVKNQKYCSRDICQRTRKSRWQRRKMATDADYRQNQKDSRQMWQTQHPGYWQQYRDSHPQYRERNRTIDTGSPIKGRVKKKNTSPEKKHAVFSLHLIGCRLGLKLLIIFFRTRYFRLWFAWSLTRISHPSGSRRLCY
jgi:hypothetical protein